MNRKNYLYSSREFAKFTGVNKRTLHYYNDIGLFCPEVIGENGYHYYTCFQFAQLELIGQSIKQLLSAQAFLEQKAERLKLGMQSKHGSIELCTLPERKIILIVMILSSPIVHLFPTLMTSFCRLEDIYAPFISAAWDSFLASISQFFPTPIIMGSPLTATLTRNA